MAKNLKGLLKMQKEVYKTHRKNLAKALADLPGETFYYKDWPYKICSGNIFPLGNPITSYGMPHGQSYEFYVVDLQYGRIFGANEKETAISGFEKYVTTQYCFYEEYKKIFKAR